MKIELQTTVQNVNSFFEIINERSPIFQDRITTKWNCQSCKEDQNLTEDFCIALDEKSSSRNIESLLTLKSLALSENHFCASRRDGNDSNVNVGNNVDVCLFYSSAGMDVNLENPIRFGENEWKCSSLVTSTRSVFKDRNGWFFCEDKNLNHVSNKVFTDVFIATYEKVGVEQLTGNEKEYCYTGDELMRLRNMLGRRHTTPDKRKGDRHKTKGDRHTTQGDRHTTKEDRHTTPDERKGDRHTTQREEDRHKTKGDRHTTKGDRHTTPGDRHKDKEERKTYNKKYYQQN